MKNHPALMDFSEKLNAKMDVDYHYGFLSIIDDLERLVYQSDILEKLAHRELYRIANDPGYASPTWETDYIIFAAGKHWELRVGNYRQSSEFIYTMPQHMMIAVLGCQPLRAKHYKIPASLQIEKFDHNVKLDDGVERLYHPGSIVVMDGRRDIFDVNIDSPVLVVKLSSMPHQPLQWAFDRKTREAVQVISSNAIDSELVSMAQTLGAMTNPLATPSLLELCNHPRHFVRWAAMQALGRVAPDELLRQLRNAAANDPHPHVQAAAEKALSRIFA